MTKHATAPFSKADMKVLKDLRKMLTMERASFSHIFVSVERGDVPLPTSEDEVDHFIRERTRVWRRSWLLAPLDSLIARGVRGTKKPVKGGVKRDLHLEEEEEA